MELICLFKTNRISGILIGSLSEKAAAADVKAQSAIEKSGIAVSRAGAARDDAAKVELKMGVVAEQADGLALRMRNASKQLVNLEHETFIQSPRGSLIATVAPKLSKLLSLFAGQRVDLFVCGRFGSQDAETLSTWGAIANLLEGNGAKWKVEHGGLQFFDRCSPGGGQPLGQGVMVFVNKAASRATMEAANRLGGGLANALPPSPDKVPGIVDADFSKRFTEPIGGKDTPWAMVANDPGLITVLIGAHPQQ